MQIKVTIPNLSELQAKLEQYPAISEKYVNQAINASLVRILGEEKQTAPVFIGTMRDNWTITMGRFQGTLQSNVPYSGFIQTGTAPHFPPIDAITPWATAKGIPPWALAISISKKGTKANPFMTVAISNAQSGINKEFQTALNGILKEIST